MLKNESFQNYVLTIPLCTGGRDEATGENGVEIGRRKRPHAPSLSGEVAGHAHRCASRVTRVFFTRRADPTRMPDDPTHVPDPDKDDVIMTSACRVGMPCQHPVIRHVSVQSSDTSSQWDPPATSSVVSRAELSRAEWSGAEPSRAEPRADEEDSVQRSLRATGSEIESGPLIRPELF